MKNNNFVPATEAAKILGITKQRVDQLIKENAFGNTYKRGKNRFVDIDQYYQYKEEKKAKRKDRLKNKVSIDYTYISITQVPTELEEQMMRFIRERKNSYQSELAKEFGVHTGTSGKLIARLMNKDLVEYEGIKVNKGSIRLIRLTTAGKRALKIIDRNNYKIIRVLVENK